MVFGFPEHFQSIPFKGKGLNGPFQFIERQSGIEEGADKHVPTHPGKAIQVGHFHENVLFYSCKLPRFLSGR